MIEDIRDFILTYSGITELNVNYLRDKLDSLTVNEDSGYNPLIETSITGEEHKRFQFNIDAMFSWTEETQNNINNSKFFEDFRDWLKQKNNNKEFPSITGVDVEAIEAVSNGYIYITNSDKAIYRISCAMYYYE